MRNQFKLKGFVFVTSMLLLLLVSNKIAAQVPGAGIFFQAVARDSYSNPAKDRKIVVETSLIQTTATGSVVLRESFETTTDASGIFSVSIGEGTRLGGSASNLSGIEWSKGPYFLNIKVAIAPIMTQASWDYTKDLVDLGTSPFGAVPFAMYAGSVAGFDTKVNVADTAKMLLPYAKSQTLTSIGANKLNVADSITKYVTPTQLNAKAFDITPINNALASKINLADSITKYVTPAQLNSKTFDSSAIYNQLALRATITDVNSGLGSKENINNKTIDVALDGTSDTKYPSVKAVKTYVDASIVANTTPLIFTAPLLKSGFTISIPQANGSNNGYLSSSDWTIFNNKQNPLLAGTDYVTPAQITLSSLGAEATANKSNDIAADASSTTKFPSVKAIKDYVDVKSANASVADNTITSAKINGTIAISKGGTGATTAADARTNLGLVIGTDVMAATATTTLTGDVTGTGNGSFATTVTSVGGISAATIAGLPTSVNANTASITAETTRATNAENALDTRVTSNTASITAETTRATNAENALDTRVTSNTASITAETTRATNAENTLDTRVTSNTASITANTNSIATNSADILLKAPLASPVFTGTPVAPTPATNDNSTTVATTAYVKNSIIAANAGLSSIGAISATSNAKGATISGTTELILTPADASNGGVVTTGTQTFAGSKTFTNTVTFGKDITVNGMTFGRPANPFASNTQNIAIGNNVMGKYAPTAWTTDYNIGIGYSALFNLTNGGENVAIGSTAMYLLSSGDYNTGIGSSVMSVLTTGNNNTVLGAEAGRGISTGSENTFIGSYTGVGMSGSNNILIGSNKANNYSLGTGITTGNSNTIIGSGIRSLPTTLSNNVILADGDGNIRAQHNGSTGWTIGTIVSGTWSGTTIGSNVGGAGTVNGLMKANGSGVVSAAVAGTDYQSPLTAGSGISINAGTISATGLTSTNLASNAAITNGQLANSTSTIGSTTMTLGGTITSVTGLSSVSSTNFTGALTGDVTGNVTGNLTGNASTATKLAATKNINGIAFDGSADITIAANSNTLTGTTLASNVVSSSLTSVGTITSGVWSGTAIANTNLANSALTIGSTNIALGATSNTLAGLSTVTSNNFVGALTGNASTATKLAATKNINGVAFDGSADITVAANSNTLTGTTLASNVVSSSLTSVGTITSGVWSGTAIANANLANSALTIGSTNIALGATASSLAGLSTVTSTNFVGALTGNASTATKISTGRTISTTGDITYTSGSFDGSGDVTGVATLAASGVSSGTYGSSTAIPVLTVDTKGRVTSASTVGIIAGVNSLNYTSTTSYAAGGTISGTSLTLTPADESNPGLISTGTQTIVGAKTFSNTATFNSDITVYGLNIGRGSGSIVSNTSVGNSALPANTTGNRNTASGYQALQANTTGSANTAFGYQALQANTTGFSNVAVGNGALYQSNSYHNIGIGESALAFNYSGAYNIGIGRGTMTGNKYGSSNIAIGSEAGYNLNNYNYNSGTGGGNVFIGFQAARGVNLGSNNTALGTQALNNNLPAGNSYTYSNNVAIGSGAGQSSLSDNNTFLGANSNVDNTNVNYTNFTNSTAVGYNAIVTASNSIQLGNTNVTAVNTSGTINAAGFSGPLTGNATTATTAGNITATSNTTLTSLANLATVGTITAGTWSATEIAITKGGTGATTASGARTNLGLGSIATKSTIADADVDASAAIAFSKLNITKANITGLGVQEGLTAGSGISISAGTISATGLTTSNLASNAAITNAQLANSTTTLGSTTMTLGGTVTSVAGLTSLTATTVVGNLSGTATTATNIAGGLVGSIPYQTAAGTTALLAGNTTSTVKYLASSGNGTNSTAPTWVTPSFVPYTGATAAVDLGAYDLTVNSLTVGRGKTSVSSNSAFGVSALYSNTSGSNNTGVGYYALSGNISGTDNTAVGYYALQSNNSNSSNNSAFGSSTLYSNTSGIENTAIGSSTLYSNTSGSDNTAVGYSSSYRNISGSNNATFGSYSYFNGKGSRNSAFGHYSLISQNGGTNTGSDNAGFGYQTGYSLTTGNKNIFLGNTAGFNISTSSNNIMLGWNAGSNYGSGSGTNTTGLNSVLIGYDVRPSGDGETNEIVIAGYTGSGNGMIGNGSNTTTIGNSSTTNAIIYGSTSLSNLPTNAASGSNGGDFNLTAQNGNGTNKNGGNINLTPGTKTGTGTAGKVIVNGGDMTVNGLTVGLGKGNISTNTALGASSLGASTTSSSDNTAVGSSALMSLTNGTGNTAVGSLSLYYLSTLSANSAIGYQAGQYLTSGGTNTIMGYQTMNNFGTGSDNTVLGALAMQGCCGAAGNASSNTVIGTSSFLYNTSGSKNVMLGMNAGKYYGGGQNSNQNTGTNNGVYIGYDVRPSSATTTNEIVIAGYDNSNYGYVGNGSNTVTIGNGNNTANYLRGTVNINTGTTTQTLGANLTGSVNDFLEYNVKNTSTGLGAQSGYNAMANNGDDYNNFVWMGINSSTFSNTTAYNIGGANDVSFLGAGNDLYVANNNTSKSIIFSTGAASPTYFNERMRITATGNVGIGTNSPTSTLEVAGQVKITGGSPGAGKVLTSDANGLASWTYGAGTTSTQSGSYTITLSDKYVFYSTSATGVATFTLPAATSNAGKEIIVKNKSAYTLTIQRSGSETIFQENSTGNSAATSITLGIEASNNWVKLVSDGTQWVVFRALF